MNSNSETEPCIVEKKGWRCRVRDVVLGDEVKSKEEARLVQKLGEFLSSTYTSYLLIYQADSTVVQTSSF